MGDQLEENKHNPKSLWSHLKSLGHSNNSKSSPNVVLNVEGNLCFEAKTIANHFNYFFTTVASVLVDKLPTAPNLFNTASNILNRFTKTEILLTILLNFIQFLKILFTKS